MLSDSSKSAFKMASEDKKNMKLSGFFSNLWGLNYQSYQLFEATFLSFLSFNFYFGHKTPGGLKTWEN